MLNGQEINDKNTILAATDNSLPEILRLPLEILQRIFSFLTNQGFARAMLVCRAFKVALSGPSLHNKELGPSFIISRYRNSSDNDRVKILKYFLRTTSAAEYDIFHQYASHAFNDVGIYFKDLILAELSSNSQVESSQSTVVPAAHTNPQQTTQCSSSDMTTVVDSLQNLHIQDSEILKVFIFGHNLDRKQRISKLLDVLQVIDTVLGTLLQIIFYSKEMDKLQRKYRLDLTHQLTYVSDDELNEVRKEYNNLHGQLTKNLILLDEVKTKFSPSKFDTLLTALDLEHKDILLLLGEQNWSNLEIDMGFIKRILASCQPNFEKMESHRPDKMRKIGEEAQQWLVLYQEYATPDKAKARSTILTEPPKGKSKKRLFE